MIQENEIIKRLTAKIECQRDTLPMKPETAIYVVRILASHIREMVRDALNEAKREWTAKERQQ